MDDTPVISLPGSKMKIERIPMSDEFLRLECLKLAVEAKTASVTRQAGIFESHVRYGRLKDETGSVSIAPELFIDDAGDVISFKGENFYRACNMFVRRGPDGSSSHCVKRAEHSLESGCEDYDGNKVGS